VVPSSALFHGRRHLPPRREPNQQPVHRQYTDAEGRFPLKMIPGLRYERLRYPSTNEWQELARAERLRTDFLQGVQTRAFKIHPRDKGRWRTYTTADGQTMKPVAADLIRTNDWIDTLHLRKALVSVGNARLGTNRR